MIREDYHMGWVIQPLNSGNTHFYLYPRLDTSKTLGEIFVGNRLKALARVEELVQKNTYGYSS